MSGQRDDGGPAFPLHDSGDTATRPGMSLRDYFAAAALQGWLSGPCQGDVLDDYEDDSTAFSDHCAAVARTCYAYADAMMRERERK